MNTKIKELFRYLSGVAGGIFIGTGFETRWWMFPLWIVLFGIYLFFSFIELEK